MGLFDDPNGIDWGQLATGMQTPGAGPNFADRFKGGPPLPIPSSPGAAMAAPPPGPMQSPISPEVLAASAAARGIPPPAKDLTPELPPIRMHGSTFGPNDGGMPEPGAVGAALTGGGPTDITSPAQKAGLVAPETPAAGAPEKMGKFAEALKGVKMPADPTLQKISSPSVARPSTQIKGGDLMALLSSLNAAPGAGGLKLPATLAEAFKR